MISQHGSSYFRQTDLPNAKQDRAPMQQVQIEPITPEQYHTVAKLMAFGFGHKFVKLSSLSVMELASIFENWLRHTTYQTGSLRVTALENDVVIGTMALRWKSSEIGKQPKTIQTKWWKMYRYNDYWKLLQFLMRIQLLKHKTEAGECYIEDIVVHPDHQGKGVGRHLLAWAEQYMLQTANLSYLSLHVAQHNQKAMQMYEHYHFHKQNSTNSLLTAMLLGEHQWNYMIRKGDS